MNEEIASRIVEALDTKRLVTTLQEFIRFPSFTFEESKLAECVARRVWESGMEVEIQKVQGSKQVVGTLRGTGGGESVMFCGHLDIDYWTEDDWSKPPFEGVVEGDRVYGAGACNMKSGLASMLMAIDAISKAKIKLKGDLLYAAVMGEMNGGIGVQYLIDKGIRADHCIIGEPTRLRVPLGNYGAVRAFAISTYGKRSWALWTRKQDPVEKMLKIIEAMGPTFTPIKSGGWLTFKPNSKYPNYPMYNIFTWHAGFTRDHRVQMASYSPDVCTIMCDFKFAPNQGITMVSIVKDLERLIEKLKKEDPDFKADVQIVGPPQHLGRTPFELTGKEKVIQTLTKWHEYVTGERAKDIVTEDLFCCDADRLYAVGIPTAVYGPSAETGYSMGPDEMVSIKQMITTAKVYALTAAELCTISEKVA